MSAPVAAPQQLQTARRFMITLALIVAGLVIAGIIFYPQFIRRRDFALLDRTLGTRINSPQALMDVLALRPDALQHNDYGLSPWEMATLQHQALVQLLALQKSNFQNGIAAPADACMPSNRPGVFSFGMLPGHAVLVMGTPTIHGEKIVYSGLPEWSVQLFTFAPDGRLLRRSCYSEQTKDAELNRLAP